jgi:hypothetical protein
MMAASTEDFHHDQRSAAMNVFGKKYPARLLLITILTLLLTTSVVGADAPTFAAPAADAAAPAATPNELFTLNLDIPHGARIDYLRLLYYDKSAANSQAYITAYDAQGSLTDLTELYSSGNSGYGYQVSAYLGHVVDTESKAYVLNWRANQRGSTMRLCGLRVAYRLPVGAGWSNFYYFFAAGSSMQPRDSGTPWTYDGAGCISVPYQTFLPLIRR